LEASRKVVLVAPKGINCLKFSKMNKLNDSRRKVMGGRCGRKKEKRKENNNNNKQERK